MRVNGSGGSFVQQAFQIPLEAAWQLGLMVIADMGIEAESQDDQQHLFSGSLLTEEKSFLFGRPKLKFVTFAVQPLEEGCQVIVDIHKKHLEVYSLTPQNRETKQFMELFQQKVDAYLHQRICSRCGQAVAVGMAFCPYCGQKLD